MNLTRMRHYRMSEKLLQAYFDYSRIGKRLTAQHVFNILLYYNPELLKLMPCSLHFLESFCEEEFYCKEALEDNDGVHLIHGNDGSFMSSRIFDQVYGLFKQVRIYTKEHTAFF